MTLYQDVAEALRGVEGLNVVDYGDPDQPVGLPVAYLGYGGHERPTSAAMKPKIDVAIIAAWAAEDGAHQFIADLAERVVAALEAMERARLLSAGAVVELAPPTDETITALGLELVVISA